MNKKEQLEAQVKELEDKLSEMKATINQMEEEKKSFKRWRAEKLGEYYYGSGQNVYRDLDKFDVLDNSRYNLGNYYKTKEEAERARDSQLAIVRVNDAIDEENEGWTPDWNSSESKYYICNIDGTYDYFIINREGYKGVNLLNYMKTKEIADRIISEHREDLNLIFNVK